MDRVMPCGLKSASSPASSSASGGARSRWNERILAVLKGSSEEILKRIWTNLRGLGEVMAASLRPAVGW